jgi:hypothetical protein
LERVKGIEPSSLAWEAKALPLSYTRNDAYLAQLAALCKPQNGETGAPLERAVLAQGQLGKAVRIVDLYRREIRGLLGLARSICLRPKFNFY